MSADVQSANLRQAGVQALKLSQDIRVILSPLAAAQSLKDRINPRAANGLTELFDVVDAAKGMTHRMHRDGKALGWVVSEIWQQVDTSMAGLSKLTQGASNVG